MRPATPFIAVVLLAALACGWAGARLESVTDDSAGEQELLLLPNGKHLKVASLGQAPVLADLIYLWAIQYYSSYEREDRFRYVEHVFGSVISELDPHYIDAYWMGALILIVEARDIDGGLALLDKGIAANPDNWLLPYLAGWETYHVERYDRAEEYFAMAEAIPGAPPYVRRTRIGMAAAKGDHRRAYAMWLGVLQDAGSDAGTIDIAERQLRHLKIKIDIQEIAVWVEKFRSENDRWPRSLNELVITGYSDALPIDPLGRPYAFDPLTGDVAAQQDRVLSEEA